MSLLNNFGPLPASNQLYQKAVTGAIARPIRDYLSENQSVRDFGAVGDGTTDDTAAFRAAAATGRPIAVPWTPDGYILTGQIDLVDGSLFFAAPDARAAIRMVSDSTARVFDALGKAGCGLVNLTIDGAGITTDGVMVRYRDCACPAMDGCKIVNAPVWASGGTVSLSGTTTRASITRCIFENCDALAGVYLTGAGVSDCRVEDNEFRDMGGFGIFADNGANRNIFSRNVCVDTAKEGIALTHPCAYNQVLGNRCERAGDNGISISGLHNAVSGNLCLYNAFAGIGVWGSFNALTGNLCIGNDQSLNGDWGGVWIATGYGGIGQNNIIAGNVFDDDQAAPTQKWGVRIKSNSYAVWSTGIVATAGMYVYYGLHVYKAVGAGTTGATPPTHTAGDVSDGAVTWTYYGTAISQMTPRTNTVIGNVPGRVAAGGQQFIDNSNWVNNMLVGYGKNTRVPWPTAATGLLSGEIWKDTAAGNVLKVA